MKEGTREELADFLRFCRSERRLAPMTCSAYARDVSACLDYLQGQGIDVAEVRVTHLRAFLAEKGGELGYTFVDQTPALQAAARRLQGTELLYFPVNLHFTPAGNRVVAEALAAALTER